MDGLIYGIGNYKWDPRGQHALFILRNFWEGTDECKFSDDCKMRIAQWITPQVLYNWILPAPLITVIIIAIIKFFLIDKEEVEKAGTQLKCVS